MPEPDLTLIALDVDGVLNSFTKKPRTPHAKALVGRWNIQWQQAVLDRLKALLALPNVEGAWVTTWLEEPWLLDELEQALGLEGLVPHRADHPAVQTRSGHTIINDVFDEYISFYPETRHWWKLRAMELLIDRLRPARLAWLDDDLGSDLHGDSWRLGITPERFLLRPHAVSGLLPGDMSQLEHWVSIGDPPARRGTA
ncbi:hypothetical protein SAMN04489806_1126 [Paramicrobacterium humi]|uniref:HAD family hydrolase n=1 Tax=Paramicrobacterium humi TaxID=640635 RepID=A0A1H4KE53_9MICO|nr:HAD domain-containing protein [Microbacterium humi]SEB56673.1 hypothetical protein SAMN04489806_1126 [Microbacterium humi]